MTAPASYSTVVQELYVTYFGRPADYFGLQNFEAALAAANAPTTIAGLQAAYSTNAGVATLVNAFGTSAESQALYGSITGSAAAAGAFVQAVFQNLFGRAPAVAGLNFWVGAIINGSVTPGDAALSIAAGAAANTSAQGMIDAQSVANKVAVATEFTNDISTSSTEITAYSGHVAAGLARALITGVTSATNTATYDPTVQATIQQIVNGGPINPVFVLDTNVHTIDGSTSPITTVDGDLTPFLYNGKGPTLIVGDSISNVATLNITDQYGQGNDVIPSGATLNNIATVNLTTQGVAGGGNSQSGAWFDVSGIAGLQVVNVVSNGGTSTNPLAGTTGTADLVRDIVGTDNTTAAAINVTQNNLSGVGVTVAGGSSVNVVDYGGGGASANNGTAAPGVLIGSIAQPTANTLGSISVQEYGNNAVTVYGAANKASTVTVTDSGNGNIKIGQNALTTVSPATNPLGNVTVTDTDTQGNNAATPTISIYGGANDTVNYTGVNGGTVTIGAVVGVNNSNATTSPSTNQSFVPSGNVVVNDNAVVSYFKNVITGQLTGNQGNVTIVGGVNDTVFSDTGNVTIGVAAPYNGTTLISGAPLNAGAEPTGVVNVTDVSDVTVANGGGGGVTVYGGVGVAASGKVAAVPAVTINTIGNAVTVGAVNTGVSTTTLLPINASSPVGSVVVNDGVNLSASAMSALAGLPIPVLDGINDKTAAATTILGANVTNVTVNSNAGSVTVGSATNATLVTNTAEPTGTIVVNDSVGTFNVNGVLTAVGDQNAAAVNVYGASGAGSSVTVVTSGGPVVIGTQNAAPFTLTTGAINVTQNAIETGGQFASTVTLNGGTGITVNTTGGSVIAGAPAVGGVAATAPVAGAVVINDTFNIMAGSSAHAQTLNADAFTVDGGTTVNITTTPTSGAINVGAVPTYLVPAGNALTALSISDFASGNVTITNVAGSGATTNFGSSAVVINTLGATTDTVIGAGNVLITDEQSVLSTQGTNAGTPIGATTLNTVFFDGVTSGTITTNPTGTLTFTTLDDVPGGAFNIVGNTNPHALALTIGNDNTSSVTDNTATSITVVDSKAGKTGLIDGTGATTLVAAKAVTITVTNSGNQSIVASNNAALTTLNANNTTGSLTLTANNEASLANVNANNQSALTLSLMADPSMAIAANNTGSLTIGDIHTSGASSITAGGTSTGSITAQGIVPGADSFFGGAGVDTVTIYPSVGAGVPITGGSATGVSNGGLVGNELIAKFPGVGLPGGALLDTVDITNFQSFLVTGGTDGGTYTAAPFKMVEVSGNWNYFNPGLNNASLGSQFVTFTGATATEALVLAGTTAEVVTYALATDTTHDTLALTVNNAGVWSTTGSNPAIGGNYAFLPTNHAYSYLITGGASVFGGLVPGGASSYVPALNATVAGETPYTAGRETIAITATGSNNLYVVDPATKALSVSGSGFLNLSGFGGGSLSSINVSGSAVLNTTGILSYSPNGVTINDTSTAATVAPAPGSLAGVPALTANGSMTQQHDVVAIQGSYAAGDTVTLNLGAGGTGTYTVVAADVVTNLATGALDIAATEVNVAGKLAALWDANNPTQMPVAQHLTATNVPTNMIDVFTTQINSYQDVVGISNAAYTHTNTSGGFSNPAGNILSVTGAPPSFVSSVAPVIAHATYVAGPAMAYQDVNDVVTYTAGGQSVSYTVTAGDVASASTFATDLAATLNGQFGGLGFTAGSVVGGAFVPGAGPDLEITGLPTGAPIDPSNPGPGGFTYFASTSTGNVHSQGLFTPNPVGSGSVTPVGLVNQSDTWAIAPIATGPNALQVGDEITLAIQGSVSTDPYTITAADIANGTKFAQDLVAWFHGGAGDTFTAGIDATITMGTAQTVTDVGAITGFAPGAQVATYLTGVNPTATSTTATPLATNDLTITYTSTPAGLQQVVPAFNYLPSPDIATTANNGLVPAAPGFSSVAAQPAIPAGNEYTVNDTGTKAGDTVTLTIGSGPGATNRSWILTAADTTNNTTLATDLAAALNGIAGYTVISPSAGVVEVEVTTGVSPSFSYTDALASTATATGYSVSGTNAAHPFGTQIPASPAHVQSDTYTLTSTVRTGDFIKLTIAAGFGAGDTATYTAVAGDNVSTTLAADLATYLNATTTIAVNFSVTSLNNTITVTEITALPATPAAAATDAFTPVFLVTNNGGLSGANGNSAYGNGTDVHGQPAVAQVTSYSLQNVSTAVFDPVTHALTSSMKPLDTISVTIDGVTSAAYTVTAADLTTPTFGVPHANTLATDLSTFLNAHVQAGFTVSTTGTDIVITDVTKGDYFTSSFTYTDSTSNGSLVTAGLPAAPIPTAAGAGNPAGALAIAPTNAGVLGIAQVDKLTVNGNFAIGDTLTLTYTETGGVPVAETYTVAPVANVVSDATVAAGLAALLNGQAGLPTVTATGAVITVTTNNITGTNWGESVATTVSDAVNLTGSTHLSPTDSITVGSGGGVITLGQGGEWSPWLPVSATLGLLTKTYYGSYSSGSESVNLSAAAAASSTLWAPDGVTSTFNLTHGAITGFKATPTTWADVVTFATVATPGVASAAKTNVGVLANVAISTTVATAGGTSGNNAKLINIATVLDPSGATASDFSNIAYTAANGVITFTLTGAHFLGNIGNDYLYAAEAIVSLAGPNTVAEFSYNGSTFVVESGAHNYLWGEAITSSSAGIVLNDTTVLQLQGVASSSGFGGVMFGGALHSGIGATGAVLANANNNLAPSTTPPLGLQAVNITSGAVGTGAVVYNDAGYSADWLNAATQAGSTTFNNLAPASELFVNTGTTAATAEAVTVTQTASGSGNSLFLDFQGASYLSTLTLSNDWEAALYVENAVGNTPGVVINNLTDGQATQTMKTLVIAGTGGVATSIEIDSINDTALTLVDAQTFDTYGATFGFNGALVLTDATVHNNLTILGSFGSDIITANGTQDIINVASATSFATITANGAGDTITAGTSNGHAVAGNVLIMANGAGDAITAYTTGGTVAVTANGTLGTAAGDHITLTSTSGAIGLQSVDASDVIVVAGNNGQTNYINASGQTNAITIGGGNNVVGTWAQTANPIAGPVAVGGAGPDGNVYGFGNINTGGFLTGGDTVTANNTTGTDYVWTGANSLLTLANGFGSGTVDLYVANDLTAGGSSTITPGTASVVGSGLTTVAGANTTGGGHLNIVFGNVGADQVLLTEAWSGGAANTSFVNTASATSLAAALDMAASQAMIVATQTGQNHTTVASGLPLENAHTGLIDWFQYNGNTYIVEAINNALNTNGNGTNGVNAAAHSTLAAGDAVVELVGLVNLNGATFGTVAGHTLHVV